MRQTEVMAGGSGRGHEHPLPPVPASGRHVWVRGGPDVPGPHPGIVVEWQQSGGAWFALVADLIEADRVLVQQWLSAELLTRIG
ncbi:hypothetical protein GCM10009858_46840 [Terrabacter carboxydivorans]|uniref:Uncharacterized protein n=1 Tax=Terrabacter carboxydivorans TaxID=619730 RepID=A0ABN3MJY3_9MICO